MESICSINKSEDNHLSKENANERVNRSMNEINESLSSIKKEIDALYITLKNILLPLTSRSCDAPTAPNHI
jgi:hypothetical protein